MAVLKSKFRKHVFNILTELPLSVSKINLTQQQYKPTSSKHNINHLLTSTNPEHRTLTEVNAFKTNISKFVGGKLLPDYIHSIDAATMLLVPAIKDGDTHSTADTPSMLSEKGFIGQFPVGDPSQESNGQHF